MATNKQRREAERRRLQRQTERRREQAARRRKTNLIISVVGVLVVVAGVMALLIGTNGDDDKPAAKGSSTPSPTAPASSASSSAARTPTYPCDWTKAATTSGRKGITAPSTTRPPKTGKVTVSVRTNRGSLAFALDRALAPCTVESFVSLVKQGYYDASPCHRLTTEGIYVLQCGDPTGTGMGGPPYSIPDEATGTEAYPAGTIAMARSQTPHSGGSQFFIVYKDSPNLVQGLGQLQYTVFGTVSSGLNVVTKVAAGGVTPVTTGGATPSKTDGKPTLPITLAKLSVAK